MSFNPWHCLLARIFPSEQRLRLSLNWRHASGRHRSPRLEVLEERILLTQYVVTSVLDDGSAGTLRNSIEQANATAGADEIVFDASVFGSPQMITLSGGQLTITDPLTIAGPGADHLTLSGNHTTRVFEVSANVTTAFSSLTIKDGNADSFGGGIYNHGTSSVSQCVLEGNSVNTESAIDSGSYQGLGGGIYILELDL